MTPIRTEHSTDFKVETVNIESLQKTKDMMRPVVFLFFVCEAAHAFAPPSPLYQLHQVAFVVAPSPSFLSSQRLMAASGDDEEDIVSSTPEAEGTDLMAEFYKLTKERHIELQEDDLDDWDDDEEDEEGETDTIGDDPIEKEVTAGDVAELKTSTAGATDEKSKDDKVEQEVEKPKEYKIPTKIPDPDLTAGDVVKLVLDALAHNDVPTKNKGIEILFAYSSEHSQVKQMDDLTPEEYADYLREGDYNVVFKNLGVRMEKGEYSPDGSKAYYTARIQTEPSEFTPVNFILSTGGDDDAWMVDSMLIRPPGMRRNRRR